MQRSLIWYRVAEHDFRTVGDWPYLGEHARQFTNEKHSRPPTVERGQSERSRFPQGHSHTRRHAVTRALLTHNQVADVRGRELRNCGARISRPRLCIQSHRGRACPTKIDPAERLLRWARRVSTYLLCNIWDQRAIATLSEPERQCDRCVAPKNRPAHELCDVV
jgi:hypothetical protein